MRRLASRPVVFGSFGFALHLFALPFRSALLSSLLRRAALSLFYRPFACPHSKPRSRSGIFLDSVLSNLAIPRRFSGFGSIKEKGEQKFWAFLI